MLKEPRNNQIKIRVNNARHGSGLGLSISKGIIELHGGEIWAESEGSGMGTSFAFTIPR
jgi:signal transduction histidine kinase